MAKTAADVLIEGLDRLGSGLYFRSAGRWH